MTNGFKDNNIQMANKTSNNLDKSSKKKSKKSSKMNPEKAIEQKKILNKAIIEPTENILKNRPDFIINQNNESTFPTTSNNKQNLYSNEITKSIKSPEDTNNNKKKKNNNLLSFYTFGNSYKNSNGELNNNNFINNNIENNINNNVENNIKNNINNKDDIDIINENNEKDNIDFENDINDDNNMINNINNNNKISLTQNSKMNNKNKSKTESNQSLELNMTMLTPEGVDKIKLLEEYISQIKEHSKSINESKIQELQNKKDQLEYNIKYLSNNIRLITKQFHDNNKTEKNLEVEKEKNSYYMNCESCSSEFNYYSKSKNCLNCNKYVNYEQTQCIYSIPEGYYLQDPKLGIIDKCYELCKTCSQKEIEKDGIIHMNCDTCVFTNNTKITI